MNANINLDKPSGRLFGGICALEAGSNPAPPLAAGCLLFSCLCLLCSPFFGFWGFWARLETGGVMMSADTATFVRAEVLRSDVYG